MSTKPIDSPADRHEFAHLLTYGDYLKVSELISLQQLRSRPARHDELQFIIVHQVFELWFKLVLHELDRIVERVDHDDLGEALHGLRRIHAIQGVLLRQIHVLETMRPVDFLDFRVPLKPASGFQSAQFREIEFFLGLRDERLYRLCQAPEEQKARLRGRMECKSVARVLLEALSRHGFAIDEEALLSGDFERGKPSILEIARLYAEYSRYPLLYELVEAFIVLDENLLLWRRHHVLMVERQIGNRPGTGAPVNEGLDGARYLASTLQKRVFPWLWEARNHLEEEAPPS